MKAFIIGVAGGSGSGKSTVTEQIISTFNTNDVCVFLQDNYYLDRSHLSVEERDRINFDHPEALDWALMKQQLNDLYEGVPINMPIYDYATHTRKAETRQIIPAKIIIVEGIFAIYDSQMCTQMELRIFVDTASDIRLMRRLKRDIVERARTLDSVLRQYSKFVRPMYKKFVEPTKRNAHIIIPHGSNKAALEMIIARINNVLTNQRIAVNEQMFYEEDGDEINS